MAMAAMTYTVLYTYKEDHGHGQLLGAAWMQHAECLEHSATVLVQRGQLSNPSWRDQNAETHTSIVAVPRGVSVQLLNKRRSYSDNDTNAVYGTGKISKNLQKCKICKMYATNWSEMTRSICG